MTGYNQSFITGGIQAGEVTSVYIPQKIREDANPVIMLHGAGATNANFWNAQYAHLAIASVLAREGFPVIAGLMGGDTFANDTSQTRIDAALTYLNALLTKNYTKSHLIGLSMGAAVGIRYAGNNPSKIKSITNIIPLSSIINTYNNNVAGLRASIETAWGVVYPAALPAGANLDAVAPNITCPALIFYSDEDAVCPVADVKALASLIKTHQIIDAGTFGHIEATVWAAFMDGNGNTIKDFIIANN